MPESAAPSSGGEAPSNSEPPGPSGNSQPKGPSTGPRTPDGKRRSSGNASKHKFFVGRVLPEEEGLAAFLRKNFIRDLKPQGLLASELVDDLVLNRVLRRRLDRYTVNEFEKATRRKLGVLLEMHDRRAAEFWLRCPIEQSGAESTSWERLSPKVCAAFLDSLRTDIRERGLLPDEDMNLLDRIYGKQPTSPGALIMYIYETVYNGPEETSEMRTAERAQLQAKILQLLDSEIEHQESLAKLQADLDNMEFSVEIRVPPQPEILDQVQRYRAANAREFTQLLADFERILRVQKGLGS